MRNIGYPRLRGLADSVGDFAGPRTRTVLRDGRETVAHEFDATLAVRRAGTAELGPAELRLDLIAPAGGSAAFFGGTEARPVTVRSESVRLNVLPPPERGRPVGFTGTVGRFTLTRNVVPTDVSPGNPVTVTTRIRGVGNLDSASCAAIDLPGVRGHPVRALPAPRELTCEQVLVPEAEADVEIPGASFAYFDPQAAQYRTLRSPPVALKVVREAVAPIAAVPSASTAPMPPVADADRTAEERPLGMIAGVTAAALLVAALAVIAWRRRDRKQALTSIASAAAPSRAPTVADLFAEAERARAANDPTAFHTATFRALQGHLGGRYGVPAQGITEDFVCRVMRPAGADESVLDGCTELFAVANHARYSPSIPSGAAAIDLTQTLDLLHRVIGAGRHVEKSYRSMP